MLSVGSVGSFASAFSIGSAASAGSVLSAASRGSVMSYAGDGTVLGARDRRAGLIAAAALADGGARGRAARPTRLSATIRGTASRP